MEWSLLSFCTLTEHNFPVQNFRKEHNSRNGRIIIMCSIKDKFVVYKSRILIFSRSPIHSKTWNNYIVKNNWIWVLEEILAVKDYICGGCFGLLQFKFVFRWGYFLFETVAYLSVSVDWLFFSFLLLVSPPSNLPEKLGVLTFVYFWMSLSCDLHTPLSGACCHCS